jgi:hypothetical protein
MQILIIDGSQRHLSPRERRAAIIGRSMASILAMLLLGCQHAPPAPPYLASRPTGEIYPRASSPPPDCLGQYRAVIEDANGDVFLGCWGHKSE